MIHRFGRPVPEISMITNTVMDFIFDNHGHKLTQWNFDILSPPELQIYADAISSQGAPLDNCFGFIDGTVRPISRPGEHQRVVYNGQKRVHSLKFQSLALPNGLIGNMYGPVEGKKHDAGMLVDSNLLHELQANAISPTGHPMCVTLDKSRFDLEEAISDLESLTRLARFHNNPKAREYECVLAETGPKALKDALTLCPKNLFVVALIGDPIKSKILEKLNKILKNIKVPDERLGPSSMGYRENPVLS
ncbi:hypothetical protein QZH41_000443 [Actinostola sp. cb2023]|nr:hypothetical protein QZH41_000443 [Actinostola sp. cb2023]